VLAIVVGLVVLVIVLVGVLATNRSVADHDLTTPEGVVQAYVAAVVDGDHQAAADLLSPGSECDVTDLDSSYVPELDRVVLLDTEVDGDRARVYVETVVAEGPFGAFDYRERHSFLLERSGTGWRIAGQPWPLYECFKGD
jgi:hypothetical protein